MAKMKIKKGDLVQVISGRSSDAEKVGARNELRAATGRAELEAGDRGKQGRVLEVYPETQRVLVEGVNRRTHHLRPTQQGGAGGIEQREAPIHVSNVAIVDPEDNRPTKVGYRVETVELENGRTKQVRVRFSKRSGKDI